MILSVNGLIFMELSAPEFFTINIEIFIFKYCASNNYIHPVIYSLYTTSLIIIFSPRVLPLSIFFGLGVVIVIYLLANVAYFTLLTPREMIASSAVAFVIIFNVNVKQESSLLIL